MKPEVAERWRRARSLNECYHAGGAWPDDVADFDLYVLWQETPGLSKEDLASAELDGLACEELP